MDNKNINVKCNKDSHIWENYLKELKTSGHRISACINKMLVFAANNDVLDIQRSINERNNETKQYGYDIPTHFDLLADEIEQIKWKFPQDTTPKPSWYDLYFQNNENGTRNGGHVLILKTEAGYTCFFWYYQIPPKEINRSISFSCETLPDLLEILESVLYDYDLIK